MKFSWLPPDETGRMGLRAEPQHYDAYPVVSAFYLDSTPLLFDPDIFMVASAMLFEPWISGQVELPKAVSPAAAMAVRHYLGDANLQVHPIEVEPRAVHRGSIRLLVSSEGEATLLPNAWGRDRWMQLDCVRMDKYAGVLAGPERVTIPTNGFLFREGTGVQSMLADIACATLVASTVQVDEIVVAEIAEDDPVAERVSKLLASVGLGFGSLDRFVTN